MRPPKATPIPPDYEDRHRLALTFCQHLGINPQHVELGTLRIELGPDQRHRITWTGSTTINLDDLAALILKAHHPDELDPDNRPCPNAPLCSRPAHHPGQCHMP